jgi:hypothetical protein
MSAREYAEIADSQLFFWRRGKPCANSLFGHLMMGQERFVNGTDE